MPVRLPTSPLPRELETRPTVSYQMIRLSGADTFDDAGEPAIALRHNSASIVLSFILYFQRDATHVHDIEGFDLSLHVEWFESSLLSPMHWVIYPERLVGRAHGNVWYENVTKLGHNSNVKLPLTIIVEQAKHAVSLDKDADGTFIPYIDVNEFVTDAWGIRDSLGAKSGFLPPRWEAGMASPRVKTNIIEPGSGPKDYELVEFSTMALPAQTGYCGELERTGKLNPDNRSFCKHLQERLDERKNPGESHLYEKVLQQALLSAPALSSRVGSHPGDLISISFGRDQDLYRVSWFPHPFEVPFFYGWMVPKVRWVGASDTSILQVTAGYTPSAGRWADWYADIGYGHSLKDGGCNPATGTDDGGGPACRGRGTIVEAGMRFKGFTPIGLLGARVGLTADYTKSPPGAASDDLRSLRNIRFIYEFSIGPW